MSGSLDKLGSMCYFGKHDNGQCLDVSDLRYMVSQITGNKSKLKYRDAVAFLNERVLDTPEYRETMAFIKKNIPELYDAYSLKNQTAADYWYRYIPEVILDTKKLVNVRPLVPISWVYCTPKKKIKCSYTWLSNHDIDRAVFPFTYYYKSCVYVPATGFDFMNYKKYPEMKKAVRSYRVADMEKAGKSKILIPLISHNLDDAFPVYQHWFAICIDYNFARKKIRLSVFDSQTNEDYDFHKKAVHNVRRFFLSEDMVDDYKVSVFRHKTEHQRENGQCGIYVVDYLVSRMRGVSPEKYDSEIKPDEVMEHLRTKYFYFPA